MREIVLMQQEEELSFQMVTLIFRKCQLGIFKVVNLRGASIATAQQTNCEAKLTVFRDVS